MTGEALGNLSDSDRDRNHALAATRLFNASLNRQPCAPIRELFPDGSLEDGYAIQQKVAELSARPDRRLVGRKIGLTSAAVQRQMGVDQPDFGLLYGHMAFGDQQSVPHNLFLQPRVEAEVAFILGRDLTEQPVGVADVLRSTDFVVAAIEIVDSRIANWDINIVDTVGDNASSGAFVLGGSPRSLRDIPDLRECAMALTCENEELSSGFGAASLGHPVNAVVWLANAVASRGAPLRAGEIVLSGALGPIVPAQAGKVYSAEIEGLGSVRAMFSE